VATVQRASAFLTLPVFASVLAPDEYGRVTLLLTVFGLVTLLLSGGLEVAVFRAAFPGVDGVAHTRRIRTLVTALFVGPLAVGSVVGGVVAVGPSIFTLEATDVGLYLVAAGAFTAATVAPLALLRARERFVPYAVLTLSYTVVQLLLRVFFVAVARMGATGWVVADTVAAAVVLVISLRWQAPLLSLRNGSVQELRAGLRVGLPLVPHLAAHWGLNLSDRLVIAGFTSATVVGVYGMGYQIALAAGMAVTEINRAFMPRYGEAIHGTQGRAALSRHATHQVLATLGVTGAVALTGPQVVHHVLPSAYQDAAAYIPWVCLGFAFLGMYYVPMNIVSIIVGETGGIWIRTMIAAAANVTANLLLVPVYGPMAAAVNTALGFFVLLTLLLRLARTRCPHIELRVEGIGGAVATFGAFVVVGSVASVRTDAVGSAMAAACLIAIGAVLAFAWRNVTPAN
jgi:O-antigen/teichoic acid export membrane protein